MALGAVLENLDGVDEALHSLYEEKDGAFVLQVKGIDAHPQVRGLKSAYEKTQRKLEAAEGSLSAFGEITPEEIEELREQVAKAGGSDEDFEAKLADMKTRIEAKAQKEIEKREARNKVLEGELERRLVDNELDQAIADAGFMEAYRPAVRALLKERKPKLQEESGKFSGVFPTDLDGIPGDHAIGDFVGTWAKTDEAKAYLPPSGRSGSGANEGLGGGGGGGSKTVVAENGIVRVDPSKVRSGEVTVVSA